MDDKVNYYPTSREEWHGFYHDDKTSSIEAELDNIKSVNDQTSLKDVQEIHVPSTHLIYLCMKEFKSLTLSKGLFLHEHVSVPSFIIEITGDVTVGKSITARLLQKILARTFKRRSAQFITTNGFLYLNKVLEERGIMDREGFPESYDIEKLTSLLDEAKSDEDGIKAPIYSHSVYDVIEGEYELIQQPGVLVVEGTNALQLPTDQRICVGDFFDLSISVDVGPALIGKWYLERFGALLDTAFSDPNNYCYQYAVGKREDAFAMARSAWKTVNLPSLEKYVLLTCGRTSIILYKTESHLVDQAYLCKY